MKFAMEIWQISVFFLSSHLMSSIDSEFAINLDNMNNPFFRDDSYIFIEEAPKDLRTNTLDMKGKKR